MSPGRRVFPPLVALLAAACAEESSTSVGLSGLEPLDLTFALPQVSPDMFVTGEYVDLSVHRDLALVSEAELPPGEEYVSDAPPAETAIWDASSGVVFWPSRVQGVGEHKYIGNKGRVEVLTTVRHDVAIIGSQTGFKEQAHFFLNPLPHHIIADANVYTDSDCGLSADAKSEHSVWWEYAPGTGPSVFDRNGLTSNSGRVSQPPCEPAADTGGGGGGGGGIPEEFADDYTCYMWFTYDELTLEVLDIHATWCTGGG